MSYQKFGEDQKGYAQTNLIGSNSKTIPLSKASDNKHTQYYHGGKCENGRIINVYIDTYETLTKEGEGPIRIAQRIEQFSNVEIDWFFDLVLQNEQYFTFEKEYELISNKLKVDDPISISFITVEWSPCNDPTEDYHNYGQPSPLEDTTGSIYQNIEIPDSRPLIFGAKATFKTYISFKIIAGYTNPNSPFDAYVSVGVTAKGSGTISKESGVSSEGDIDLIADAGLSVEAMGYKGGTKIAITKDLDGGEDANEFSISVSSYLEKSTEDILEPNSLLRNSGNKIEISELVYDESTDYTTIAVSFSFEDKLIKSFRLGHPLFKFEVEVGGSLEGVVSLKIPGNIKTTIKNDIKPPRPLVYGIPIDPNKM